MIQILTIRQQILSALQRVYDSMGFDELLSADRIEKELLAAFHPTAFATTPTDGFDEMALKLGYIKLEPGQAVVPASALASAIRELRWLASSANLVSPGLWKEENSWTVSEFNNAIRAALDASGVGK